MQRISRAILVRNRGRSAQWQPVPAFRPSITDWIQAIAVVFGIAVGLWQFVIVDRSNEHMQRQAVFDLIMAGQTETQLAALRLLASEVHGVATKSSVLGKGTISMELSLAIDTIETYMDAWGFCYDKQLCAQTLALQYICERAVTLDVIRSLLFAITGASASESDHNQYRQLVHQCKRHSEKPLSPSQPIGH